MLVADGDGAKVTFEIDLGGLPLIGPAGKAAALAFLKDGWQVALAGRRKDVLEATPNGGEVPYEWATFGPTTGHYYADWEIGRAHV